MTAKKESPTGNFIYYEDSEGNGHNIPLEGNQFGALFASLIDKDGTQLGSSDHPVNVSVIDGEVIISVGDVEIGAVELKDASTDLRSVIKAVTDKNNALVTNDEILVALLLEGGAKVTDANMRVVASTTEYNQTSLVGNVLTIDSSKGIYLKNDGNIDFTITIGSFIFTVKVGEIRCIELVNAFTSVTFGANAVFRVFGIKRSS